MMDKGNHFERPVLVWPCGKANCGRLGAQTYSNLIYWNEAEHGGHFAAFEQPDIFVEEMRSAFRKLRER